MEVNFLNSNLFRSVEGTGPERSASGKITSLRRSADPRLIRVGERKAKYNHLNGDTLKHNRTRQGDSVAQKHERHVNVTYAQQGY